MNKNEKRKETYKKHNEKRIIRGVSLYEKDQKKMIAKFGKVLDATEIKNALLYNEITIHNMVRLEQIPELIKTITRIGNNINQLAYMANRKKDFNAEISLHQYLIDIKNELINYKRFL